MVSSMKNVTSVLIMAIGAVGCASTAGITKNPDGSYIIHKTEFAGIVGSSRGLINDVKKQANDYAKKEGKELQIISERFEPLVPSKSFVWYEMKFQLHNPAEIETSEVCLNKIKENPSLQIIADKIALGGVKEQTLPMLADRHKPNKAEKTAIALYGDLNRKCNEENDKFFSILGAPSSVVAVNHSTDTSLDNLLVALQNGTLTYGKYAKLRKEITDSRATAFNKIAGEMLRNPADIETRSQEIATQSATTQAQITKVIASLSTRNKLKH